VDTARTAVTAVLSVAAAMVSGCERSPSPEPAKRVGRTAIASSSCPIVTVTSESAFHFHALNEWHTGHVLVVGCSIDELHLKYVAEVPALELMDELSERNPATLPYCRGSTHDRVAVVREVNRRYDWPVVQDLCVDVVVDI
jgi:hypothetical protein